MNPVKITRVSQDVDSLNKWQRTAYDAAVNHWAEHGRVSQTCGVLITRGLLKGKNCPRKAGQGTYYEGYGRCVAHGGAKREGRAYGAWTMSHKFAEELDVSPWEALLMVIRITAGRVRYCEQVLGSATDDRQFEGRAALRGQDGSGEGIGEQVFGGPMDGAIVAPRDLSWWEETSRLERINLAKFSKAAIDAGVAQILVSQQIEEGEKVAAILVRTLEALERNGVPGEYLDIARDIMKTELLQLARGAEEVRQTRTAIEGVTKDDGTT